MIDGGSFILPEADWADGLPPPALPLPAAPLARKAAKAAIADRPQLRATGRVMELRVTSGGGGYDPANPPLVSLTAPSGSKPGDDPRAYDRSTLETEPWRIGKRAATARATVGSDGQVKSIQLTDVGAGYRETDRVIVAIAPPPKASATARSTGATTTARSTTTTRSVGAFRAPRGLATARALLEYEVGSVGLLTRGVGYGSSQARAGVPRIECERSA